MLIKIDISYFLSDSFLEYPLSQLYILEYLLHLASKKYIGLWKQAHSLDI